MRAGDSEPGQFDQRVAELVVRQNLQTVDGALGVVTGEAGGVVQCAGSFNGGTQTLATVPANRYIENCHTFSYANSAVRAAGTYTGQVTYTLTAP